MRCICRTPRCRCWLCYGVSVCCFLSVLQHHFGLLHILPGRLVLQPPTLGGLRPRVEHGQLLRENLAGRSGTRRRFSLCQLHNQRNNADVIHDDGKDGRFKFHNSGKFHGDARTGYGRVLEVSETLSDSSTFLSCNLGSILSRDTNVRLQRRVMRIVYESLSY